MSQLTVKIFDEEYVMRSKAGEDAAHLRRTAEYVNEIMQYVSSQAPALSAKQVAVMACLNLADRLSRCEDGLPRPAGGEQRVRSLAGRIAAVLGERENPSPRPAAH